MLKTVKLIIGNYARLALKAARMLASHDGIMQGTV
jgi:hypothetical protein